MTISKIMYFIWKKIFSLAFAIFLFTACTAQINDQYVSIKKVPELSEMVEYDIDFNPSKFKNQANGTQAEILFQTNDISFQFFNDVLFLNPQEGIIVGGTKLVLRYTRNSGKKWKAIDFSRFANGFHSIAKCKDQVFVVGESKYIFRSDLTFEKWEVFDSNSLYPNSSNIVWYKIRFFNENIGIAVGQNKDNYKPLLMLTENAGKSWKAIEFTDSKMKEFALVDVVIKSPNEWLILDDGIGSAFFTADAGKTWTDRTSEMQLNTDATLESLWLASSTELYGAGSRSFWKSSDFANTWTRLDIPRPFNPIEDYNEGDYLILTDITGINEDIYVTSTADYTDNGRKAFAYKFDHHSKQLKPLLLSDTASFIGDSHAIYALDKKHIYVMDRDKLFRVED